MTKVYKENIINALQTLADYDFQKQCLDNPTGGYVWIPLEGYEDIFEDKNIMRAWDAKEIVFNPKADEALRQLYILMNQMDYTLPIPIIINLPLMQTIREKALEILKLIFGAVATSL